MDGSSRPPAAAFGSIAASRPRRETRATRQKGKVNFKVKLPTAGSGQRLDRELDSDPDEPLILEEQFILRLPENSDVHKRVKDVAARQKAGEDAQEPWFRFLDSRRAIFGLGNPRTAEEAHPAKLVDLPCIIESHKTLDNARHMYKVADISQMLLVEPGRIKVETAGAMQSDKAFDVDDYVFPHGLTPPLQHVRKRRFRKRTNKRTIEAVERDVERLLELDSKAESVSYETIEAAEDLSDSSDDEQRPRRADGDEAGDTSMDVVAGEGSVGGETPGPIEEEMAFTIDNDLAAALAEHEAEGDADDSSSSSSEAGSEIGGTGEDLWGSEDEGAGEAKDDGATPMEGVTPAARSASGDDSSEDEADGGDPAIVAARERVTMAAATVKDRQATVDAKAKEAARLTQPLLKARAEQAVKQLRDSLEQAKSAHEAALADLDRLRRGGDA